MQEETFFGRLQQIGKGFLLQIHLLSGLYSSWSRKYDPGIADQGTDAAQRARMQRRGHMGRAHYGASQSRPTETKKIKSLRDLIFLKDLERRYLTYVRTDVRTDGRTEGRTDGRRHLTSNLVRTYLAFDRCGLFLGRIDQMIKKNGFGRRTWFGRTSHLIDAAFYLAASIK